MGTKNLCFLRTIPFRRAVWADISIATRGGFSARKCAEGFKKLGLADKVRFYNIAQGSLEECRYYLILAKDLGYGDAYDLMNALDEVGCMMEGYSRAIRKSY